MTPRELVAMIRARLPHLPAHIRRADVSDEVAAANGLSELLGILMAFLTLKDQEECRGAARLALASAIHAGLERDAASRRRAFARNMLLRVAEPGGRSN